MGRTCSLRFGGSAAFRRTPCAGRKEGEWRESRNKVLDIGRGAVDGCGGRVSLREREKMRLSEGLGLAAVPNADGTTSRAVRHRHLRTAWPSILCSQPIPFEPL